MYEEGNRRLSFNWLTLLIKLIILVIVVFLACWIFVRVLNNKNASGDNKTTTSAEYVNNMAAMKNAASDYFTGSRLPERVGESERLSLSQMINQKLLIDFTDDGQKCDVNSSYAQATKTADGNYALKVNLDCEPKHDFIVTTLERNTVVPVVNNTDCSNCYNGTSNTTNNSTNTSSSSSSSSKSSSSKSSSSTNKSSSTSSNTAKTASNTNKSTTNKSNTSSNTTKTNNVQTIVIKNIYQYRLSCGNCRTDVVVAFDSMGGSAVPTQVVGYNSYASRPTDPTRDGYTFVEWQLDGSTFDFNTKKKKNIILKAVWKETPKSYYSVIFNSNGGSYVDSQIVREGYSAVRPEDPVREGYTFVEWQLDGYTYDFNNPVYSNIVLVAVWKEAPKANFVVSFDSQGGTPVASQVVPSGSTATRPADPTRSGYIFMEWQLNSRYYNFDNKVTSDITLVAVWKEVPKNNYVVSFNSNGGTAVTRQIVTEGGVATKPANPTRTGYTFVEWRLNGKAYNFSTKVYSDITLDAVWSEIPKNEYIVTFDSKGGTSVARQIVTEGGLATRPANPTKSGYTFVEWQLNGNTYNFSTKVTSNITLVAVWKEVPKNSYVVTFDSKGGSVVKAQVVTEGGVATKPTNPTKSGYTFVEWQFNGSTYNFSTKIYSDITLTAVWKAVPKNNYVVTFDSNGGTSVASQTVVEGGVATKPTNPTRSGYTFVEWRLNGVAYNFSTKVTSNITLVAVWKAVPKNNYTVTFDSQGGTSVASQTVVEGGLATRPVDPTRSGYTFVEWQLNGKTYNFSTKVTSNITLKAVWEANKTRYYKLVKYSDWTDGYSSASNAENRKSTVTTYNYCEQTTRTYYSSSYVSANSGAKTYQYEFQILDLDPSDLVQGAKIVTSSKSYFNLSSYADYNNYKAEKNRFAVYMTGNTGAYDTSLPSASVFNRSSLGSSNFTFGIGSLYLQSGIYRTNITINFKNGTGVSSYTSSNTSINDPLFFVPVKFDVVFADKSDCVRDTAANSSNYSNALVLDPQTQDVWEHRTVTYKWSTSKTLSGWTYTGEYEDR